MAQYNPAWLSFNNPSKMATIPIKYLSISLRTAAPEVLDIAPRLRLFTQQDEYRREDRVMPQPPWRVPAARAET